MLTQKPYASSCILKLVKIYQVGSKQSFDITDLAVRFDYFENINMPTISGRLHLVDSGANLIASLPIQGFERVQIVLESYDNKEYVYDLRVYKVDNRFSGDRFQTYSLGLISLEALLNEGVRVAKTLKGKPDKIVKDILKQNLKTEKEIIADPSANNIIFNPGKKTPFNIINSMQMKCVPRGGSSISTADNSGIGGRLKEKTSVTSSIAPVNSSNYSKMKGTGGYLFFENRKGYMFKSIDSLCSTSNFGGEKPVAKYYQENINVGVDADRKIIDIDFVEEIDIMSKLRMGAFSSLICFYNYSTGSYEEYVYSLAESYKEMGHMGSQENLPHGQKELSKYPTRIMSVLIDDETWYNGEDIASIEKQHNKDGAGTNFPDFQKYYISQSIARVNSLMNQKVKITVTGNPELMVGDKIEIEIPNQIPTSKRSQDPYDTEHGGVYLISEVNHVFDFKKKQSNTFLTLIRDSYGKQDTASKVQ